MQKIIKTISIIFLLAGFIGFLSIGYYAKEPNPEVTAQEYGLLKCNGPIVPNGEISDDVIELVNVVFREYQRSTGYLKTVIGHAQNLLGSLSQNQGDVCNFSKCQADMANNKPGQVSNTAPNFELELNAYVVKGSVGIRPGICTPGEGVGDPCALGDIRSNIDAMQIFKSSFEGSYQNIHAIFSEKIYENFLQSQGRQTK